MELREWTVVACALGAACGPASEATTECAGQRVVLGATPLRADIDLVADCLVIPAGSTIAFPAERTTVVRARTVVIEGVAHLVGVGADGRPAAPVVSSGANCVFAHFNWASAARTAATHERGAAGQAGGTFVLRYATLVGGPARLALLHFDVRGGLGAPAQELRCGCTDPAHAGHVARGPDGPAGASGTWRFLEETP